MKTVLLLFTFLFGASALFAQQISQACYLDTALVEKNISRLDTSFTVKEQFAKGDWELFYDFGMSKKKAEIHYDKTGLKTGVWNEWFESGKLKSQWDYTSGWFNSFPIGFLNYANGKTRISRKIENDSLVETVYYPSEKISKIRKWTKAGILCNEKEWCENGQLIINYNPSTTTPLPVKKFQCNGKLKSEYNWYVYGFTGAYTEYFENGKVSMKGTYQDLPVGVTVFVARKTGDWMYYDESGKLLKTEHWDAGKLISTEK